MAYSGTYLADVERDAQFGIKRFVYHTTDSPATVGAASYITDAAASDGTTAKGGGRGMRKGDRLTVYQWSAIPTDAMANPYSAAATAPTLTGVTEWYVTGIIAATGAATLSRLGSLSGSAVYDPASLADGAGATTTVTVTGAALGDFVTGLSFSLDLQGILLTGYVSAADTVAVRFQNETTGTIDLASGTIRARVTPYS